MGSMPNDTNTRDTKNFSRWYRRRPTGEVLLDIVTQVTGVREKLPGLAMGDRAVQTWNNRLDSEFLDAFGRPCLGCQLLLLDAVVVPVQFLAQVADIAHQNALSRLWTS